MSSYSTFQEFALSARLGILLDYGIYPLITNLQELYVIPDEEDSAFDTSINVHNYTDIMLGVDVFNPFDKKSKYYSIVPVKILDDKRFKFVIDDSYTDGNTHFKVYEVAANRKAEFVTTEGVQAGILKGFCEIMAADEDRKLSYVEKFSEFATCIAEMTKVAFDVEEE